jgi:hypothetical protein
MERTATSDSSGFYDVVADLNPQIVPWITVNVTTLSSCSANARRSYR